MAELPSNEWMELLEALQRRLAALAADGMRWLNVAPDPAMAAVVEQDYLPSQGAPPDTVATPPPHTLAAKRPRPGEPDQLGIAMAEGARPHPASIATIDSLHDHYRDCLNCKLGAGRTNLVFGTGNDHPRLMFIGEGPGAEEDAQGLPFVGRAGALLTDLIKAMGLTRADVYITNVVKCRPPENRTPQPDEIASCRPILQRQIELLDPALIVTLGNAPLKVLKPSAAGITRERGVQFMYADWPVLPTFHPAYLLRNPAAIATCWTDFRHAMELAYRQT